MDAGTVVIGQQAPKFSLPDVHGAQVSSDSLRGEPVLLIFFPFAFSPICAGELLQARERRRELEAWCVRILAISCDSLFSLRAWSDQEGFDFDLLSDFWPHGKVSQTFGVLDPHRGVPLRGSFLIDHLGVVRWKVLNDAGKARNFDEYVRAASRLRA